ncbi:MAG: helix-turn-helix domain-containing protein [Clostridium sp.]|nr:helix-turn-helix domain-containing protein [Prevotella sp.]MCM1429171.1 helix-turn-helix domain-containing protein [Clostridium sp.]MCM1475855.1 helix-turn-helix domain-containing protein [Muribaculaceae bacterium]
MTENTVAYRLKLFIEYRGLSYSQFADLCDIPRPSLSQLLTGRNKKISDVLVGQIHTHFPDLNVLWLLFGEGEMLLSSVKGDPEPDVAFTYDKPLTDERSQQLAEGLFSSQFEPESQDSDSQRSISTARRSDLTKKSKENGLSQSQNDSKSIENQLIEASFKIRNLTRDLERLANNPRKVTQIMVYYDDSTFETFIPKSQS